MARYASCLSSNLVTFEALNLFNFRIIQVFCGFLGAVRLEAFYACCYRKDTQIFRRGDTLSVRRKMTPSKFISPCNSAVVSLFILPAICRLCQQKGPAFRLTLSHGLIRWNDTSLPLILWQLVLSDVPQIPPPVPLSQMRWACTSLLPFR